MSKNLFILVCTICFRRSFAGDDKTFGMTNDQVVKHLWIIARLAARQASAGMTKRRDDKTGTHDQVVKKLRRYYYEYIFDDPEDIPAFERVL
ncbi:MAG: hypothetical protein IPI04_14050 [Ignavibacteria bacterium]|nr:hypothetical protein [Ignavibacteria bacterium]